MGYEIHFPSAYGEHVWDALMAAGEPHGLRPFGLEPQRILRLQKLHILVGQDTDSESTPFGAAMPWIVKLDKEQDFIGKWALEHYAEHGAGDGAGRLHDAQRRRAHRGRGRPRRRGHARRAGDELAPLAGAGPDDRDGLGAGGVRRTTGPRSRSPTRAARSSAEIQTKPFYDPDGEVLRS